MNPRRDLLLRDYAIMQYAAIGKFGKDCKKILLEGIQRIPLGDNFEINEISCVCDYVNVTLHDSDESVNSAVGISLLSDDMIEDILNEAYNIILCE